MTRIAANRYAAGLCAVLALACQTTKPIVTCEDAFSVQPQQSNGSIALLASNTCHVPLFVELSFSELRNLAPSAALPVQQPIPPNSKRSLVSLEPIDPRKGSSYRFATSVFLGSSVPRPDLAYRYAFPFGGEEPRLLVQGVDGSLTHLGLHRYAFDFDMPIGTPVVAARGGTVLTVHDGFPPGGWEEKYRDRSNGVVVLHDDGTLGEYGHLSVGVRVKEGARVEPGDLLGLSGNSGYAMGPHLHFEVGVQRPGAEAESIPIRFRGDVVPIEGSAYGPYQGGEQEHGTAAAL